MLPPVATHQISSSRACHASCFPGVKYCITLFLKKCFLHVKSVTHSYSLSLKKKKKSYSTFGMSSNSQKQLYTQLCSWGIKTTIKHRLCMRSIVMIYSCIKVFNVILKQADCGANKGSPLLCSHGCCPECSCSPTCSACNSCTSGSLLSQECCSNPTFPEGCKKGTFV